MKLTFIECKRVGFYYYYYYCLFYTIGKGLESSWRPLISHFVFLIITHCLENLFSISLLLSPMSYSYPMSCILNAYCPSAQSTIEAGRETGMWGFRPANQPNKQNHAFIISLHIHKWGENEQTNHVQHFYVVS